MLFASDTFVALPISDSASLMTNSVTQDEDWSIISSSSDFEDESVSETSVRDDSGNSTPSETGSVTKIDESTSTIKTDNDVKKRDAVDVQGDEDATLDDVSAGNAVSGDAGDVKFGDVQPKAEIQPSAISETVKADTHGTHNAAGLEIAPETEKKLVKRGECGVMKAVNLAFAVSYVDQYFRSLSRRLFGFIWDRPLRSLQKDVAASGTFSLPLYKHAAFLVLSTLERNQDFLLYYLTACAGVAAFLAHYTISPVPESTMSSKLHQFWVDLVYEPQETGFGRFFHAAKPKQLKAVRYISVALDLTGQVVDGLYQQVQTHSNWVKSKWPESTWIISKVSSMKRAGTEKLAGLSSADVHSWFSTAVDGGQSVVRKVLAKRDPFEQVVVQKWEDVSKWLDSTLDAATEAYHNVLVPKAQVASSNAAQWLGTAKVVSEQWASRTWVHMKVASRDLQSQLTPLAHSLVDQSKILFEKSKAESKVAAIEANKVLEKFTDVSVTYGQKAWNEARTAIRNWHDRIDV